MERRSIVTYTKTPEGHKADYLVTKQQLCLEEGATPFGHYGRVIGNSALDTRVIRLGKWRTIVWFDDEFLLKPGPHPLTMLIGDTYDKSIRLSGNLIFEPIDEGEGDSIALTDEELEEFSNEVCAAMDRTAQMVRDHLKKCGKSPDGYTIQYVPSDEKSPGSGGVR